jgi:hypothetical protein
MYRRELVSNGSNKGNAVLEMAGALFSLRFGDGSAFPFGFLKSKSSAGGVCLGINSNRSQSLSIIA